VIRDRRELSASTRASAEVLVSLTGAFELRGTSCWVKLIRDGSMRQKGIGRPGCVNFLPSYQAEGTELTSGVLVTGRGRQLGSDRPSGCEGQKTPLTAVAD
jgi:hypothetical protein